MARISVEYANPDHWCHLTVEQGRIIQDGFCWALSLLDKTAFSLVEVLSGRRDDNPERSAPDRARILVVLSEGGRDRISSAGMGEWTWNEKSEGIALLCLNGLTKQLVCSTVLRLMDAILAARLARLRSSINLISQASSSVVSACRQMMGIDHQ